MGLAEAKLSHGRSGSRIWMAPVSKPPVLVMVKLSALATPRSTELLRLDGSRVRTGFSKLMLTLSEACMVTPSAVFTVSGKEPLPEKPAFAEMVMGTTISSPISRVGSSTAGTIVRPAGKAPTVIVTPVSGREFGFLRTAWATTVSASFITMPPGPSKPSVRISNESCGKAPGVPGWTAPMV